MQTQQEINFNDSHIDKLIINPPTSTAESITTMTSFKAKQSEIDEFSLFCGQNEITRSEGIRNALKWYMKIYPYLNKVDRYWNALIAWLIRLP